MATIDPVNNTGNIMFKFFSISRYCKTTTFEKNPTKGGRPAATRKEKTKIFFFDFLISVRDKVEIFLFFSGVTKIKIEIRVIT